MDQKHSLNNRKSVFDLARKFEREAAALNDSTQPGALGRGTSGPSTSPHGRNGQAGTAHGLQGRNGDAIDSAAGASQRGPPKPPKPTSLAGNATTRSRAHTVSASIARLSVYQEEAGPARTVHRSPLSHSSPDLNSRVQALDAPLAEHDSVSPPAQSFVVRRRPPPVKPRPPSMRQSLSVDRPVSVYSQQHDTPPPVAAPAIFVSDESIAQPATDTSQKRQNVMNEIVDTEQSYLADLLVFQDVYVTPSLSVFAAADHKLLFGMLDPVVALSSSMLAEMQANDTRSHLERDTLGQLFLNRMKAIADVYANYCKHNEAALQKVQEWNSSPSTPPALKAFLEQAQQQLKGRSNAWDLSSMLIKPLQRVLKYPLLLKRLASCTPATHPDFEALQQASQDMEGVADFINQVKKRKDIVEKYVQGKASVNVIHGISKKWNRGTQLLKHATGTAEVSKQDDFFDALQKQFDYLVSHLGSIEKSLNHWLKMLKESIEQQITFTSLLEQVYLADRSGIYVSMATLVRQYRQSRDRLLAGPYKDLQQRVKQTQKLLTGLQDMFKEPQLLIKKRNSKVLDYERVEGLRQKGEKIEKADLESADAFESINAQLCEELPVFFSLVQEYLMICAQDIVGTQCDFYQQACLMIQPLADALVVEGFEGESRIVLDYQAAMAPGRDAERAAREIGLLQAWCETIWEAGAFSLATGQSNMPRSPISRQTSVESVAQGPLIDFAMSGTPSAKLTPGTNTPILPQPVPVAQLQTQLLNYPVLQPTLPAQPRYSDPNAVPDGYFRVEALYAFDAEMEEELDLCPGDVVLVDGGVERNGSTEWWWGSSTRGSGWFPCSFAAVLD
ncbi:hypothetical protein HDV03_003470 [Kappamyces sp. JEL0829]|nr:hypothetical protein HDV03_003470 [Kappamyces sp. JEL0829]